MKKCDYCHAVSYRDAPCPRCGLGMHIIDTIESIALDELMRILLNTGIFINIRVLASTFSDSSYDIQLRLWKAEYVGHIEIDNNSVIRVARILNPCDSNPHTTHILLSDPQCFEKFEKIVIDYYKD